MKNIFLVFCLLIAGIVTVDAQSKAQLEKFAAEVATAFSTDQLAGLDKKRMRIGNVRMVIENSIGEPEIERFRFTSFKEMARWFKRPVNSYEARVAWPLTGCSKGDCGFFQDGGILHNHFYLTGITYGYRHKRLYLRSIEILAG